MGCPYVLRYQPLLADAIEALAEDTDEEVRLKLVSVLPKIAANLTKGQEEAHSHIIGYSFSGKTWERSVQGYVVIHFYNPQGFQPISCLLQSFIERHQQKVSMTKVHG